MGPSAIRRFAGRIGAVAAVLYLVSLISFVLIDLLPGDPTTTLLPPGTSPEAAQRVRHEMGLDLGIVTRYVRWVGHAVRGDLGTTFASGEHVSSLLTRAFTVTAELVLTSQLLALIVGLTLAVVATRRAGGMIDRTVQAATFAVVALPVFAVALVLLLVFAVHLHWFPAVGYVHVSDSPIGNLRSIVLPTLTISLQPTATYARVVRAELVLASASDHAMLARGLGLPERRIVGHALRQSLSGSLAVIGIQIAGALGGAVLVENIFALPGVGRLLLESIGRREYFVVQGAVLVIGAAFVVFNQSIDALRTWLDPRQRATRLMS